MNPNKSEVLYKVYLAQQFNRSKGDWVEQLEKDKVELNLQLTDEEIQGYSQEQFKSIVQTRIEKCAIKNLIKLRNSHSKSENLKINGFKPSDYHMSKNLTSEEVKILFKLRTRMIDVKGNFSSCYTNNIWCKLCNLFTETQQHLLECTVLRIRTKNISNFKEVDHNMIFCSLKNPDKVTKIYKILIEEKIF